MLRKDVDFQFHTFSLLVTVCEKVIIPYIFNIIIIIVVVVVTILFTLTVAERM